MRSPAVPQNLKRRILKDALRNNEPRDAAFRRIIRSVPKGKVSTYGKVAAAAGYPLYHRAVARFLRKDALHAVPWQRIVGNARRRAHVVREDDLAAEAFGHVLQPRRDVNGVAECGEHHVVAVADIADNDLAAVNADPESDRLAQVVFEELIEFLDIDRNPPRRR